jgi:hypothetical protein
MAHTPRPPRKVAICGDDLVGVTRKAQADKYEELAVQSGAKFSSAVKHIKSREGGVFTEEVFFLDQTSHETVDLRWSNAFPIRGILGTMRSDRTGREEPYWISLGPALERLMEHRGQSYRRAILISLQAAHPDLKRQLREHGLAKLWHVPRILGGLGVPRWESLWDFKVQSDSFTVRAAFSLASGSAWDSDLSVLSRPYQQACPTTLPLRRTAEQMSQAAISGRWHIVRKTAQAPPGYFTYPGPVQDLLDRLTGNAARDLFFLADMEPTANRAFSKNAGRVMARVAREVLRAQQQVVTTQGGWTCGKVVTANWQLLLERLQTVEDSRRAVYNPKLAPKSLQLDFATLERMLAPRPLVSRVHTEHPLPALAGRKAGTRIPLLGSQVLAQRHELLVEEEAAVASRPMGLEAPIREWADRQTKRFHGEALGWFPST